MNPGVHPARPIDDCLSGIDFGDVVLDDRGCGVINPVEDWQFPSRRGKAER
jgi:hypothetical protein